MWVIFCVEVDDNCCLLPAGSVCAVLREELYGLTTAAPLPQPKLKQFVDADKRCICGREEKKKKPDLPLRGEFLQRQCRKIQKGANCLAKQLNKARLKVSLFFVIVQFYLYSQYIWSFVVSSKNTKDKNDQKVNKEIKK